MEEAYKRLAPRVQIRGFRPGKAPRPLIEKQLGHHRLLDEAIDILIPRAYREAIEEQELSPVAVGSVELVSEEPLVFTATVPLQPVVELGDYQSVRVPRETVTIQDEQVEEAMQDLRRRYGTIEPVDRPAQKGDIIRGGLKAEVEGNVLYEQDEIEFRVTDEALSTLPGLSDAIVGLKKGDEVDKQSEVAAEFEDPRLAGKTASYHITVQDVKEEKLADEDDAFAKLVGEGFESVQALRDRIRTDLQTASDEEALRVYEASVLDTLVAQAQIEYPQVMLEHEIEHILEEQANLDPREARAQELYLARLGKSEQEVKDSVRPEAEQRMRRSLVLSHFAEAENITVEETEVEEELQTVAASAGEQSEALLRLLDNENGRDSLRRALLSRKTLARLVELASQAPEAPAAEEPAEKRPARSRRTAPRQVEPESTS
jgi:trigger factor